MIPTALAHHGDGPAHTLSHSILNSESFIIVSSIILIGISLIIYYLTSNK